ncbi:hypothetical protein ASE48_18280 [Mycobacterium sp. Root265]|nr:hypothetical protein ASE48_18280 [Mycobacterium sp. Root265]
MVVVLLAVTAGVTVLGSVVIARHRAQSAADLAALSAAAALTSGHQIACARAISVATAMRTTVTDCAVHGLDIVIAVAADAGVPGWRASARARAGPGEPGG